MRTLFTIITLLFCSLCGATTKYVYNVTKNEVVEEYNASSIRPIASVTKLMTAIIIVESGLSLKEKIPYKGFLGKNKQTREQLLYLMLVKSDNNAAEALAKSYYGGRVNFIIKMNIKAVEMSMLETSFEDASGIGRNNISTAKDLSILLEYAHNYDVIRNMASTPSFKVTQVNRNKSRTVIVHNTNIRLLNEYSGIEISKTGFTNLAGKCLAMFLTKNGEKYTIVILGEKNTIEVQKVGRNIIERL